MSDNKDGIMKYVEFRCLRNASLSSYTAMVLGCGKNRVLRLIKNGDVRLSGRKIKDDAEVLTGDEVGIYLADDFYEKVFDVIYRDENVIVVFKPAGIESSGDFSMEERLSAFFGTPVYACHRLDTNTTGVNLFAFNETAREEAFSAFKERRFSKEYIADVFGNPEKHALLSDYLVKDAEKGKCRVVGSMVKGSAPVITEYELKAQSFFLPKGCVPDGESKAFSINAKTARDNCLKRAEFNEKTSEKQKCGAFAEEKIKISTLLVKPQTGRTHQIRAHLAYKGLPVVGDCKYGDFALNKLVGETRQRLACVSLTGEFPKNGKLYYLSGKNFSRQLV